MKIVNVLLETEDEQFIEIPVNYSTSRKINRILMANTPSLFYGKATKHKPKPLKRQ